MPEFSFDALRRHPDVEADNLFAADASDRLILDEALGALEAEAKAARAAKAAASAKTGGPGRVVVIGDSYGALTLGAAAVLDLRGIRVHQDSRAGELALAENARRASDRDLGDRFENLPLGPELLTGARVVLMQLPRSLAELDELAHAIAAWADPEVVVYAGGRLKHMTPAMNEVLERSFGRVTATLARQKSRVLVASEPHPHAEPVAMRREFHAEPAPGLWVCATGGAFAGTKIDIGTRFLLEHLGEMRPDARTAVDLGCGTGVLSAYLARARPELTVFATDQSAAAVESARATMAANDVENVDVVRDDALSTFDDGGADLVLLNPPFHQGSTVHAGIALKLFQAAGRVLAPGGELWTVFNSHLSYRAALQRAVGETRQVARNAKFTVMVSTKR
ncbi:methyltransferase [Herbiconiux sp. VKM Ac-1786]|uniref:class I SAM-dependent methyltransferase n=1 Tax=Herbiconiux sp. VKM Ac-1786 TaxID=2783824 RepID=UPI00188ACCD7|nr:methyltransferase [Herbiconiux sp. VKM Ac-1786]